MAEPDEPFQVIWSERNREVVRSLGRNAIALGIGQQFIDDIRHVEQQLQSDPLGWGDPHFRLHTTGETVCHRIHGLVYVYYAVDENERLVFVKDILAVPGRWLED